MDIASARLAYVPFKRFPSGHTCIIFSLASGEEVVISPEADIKPGKTFSLVQGLRKTYLLRYSVQEAGEFLNRYRLEGRKIHECPVALTSVQLRHLYQQMLTRAEMLRLQSEWYHTLFNSCITNTVRHIDAVRATKRSWFGYGRPILLPVRIGNL